MAGIWVVAEIAPDGSIARLSTEIATLARELGEASGESVEALVVAADPARAADELAAFAPRVRAFAEPECAEHAWAVPAARHVAVLAAAESPSLILAGASPDGRDVAGTLSALLGWGVLANATAVAWDDGPSVEMSIFGGKLITTSRFTGGPGIVTVRPNAVTAVPLGAKGSVETVAAGASAPATSESGAPLPAVAVVDRVTEASAAAPIEEARIIVSGGRGVGGAEGFELVRQIADALGGTVGATRAAVDSGWIPYAQQIGQTGKIVKPQLYLALGISGAIQHKVGMQTSETIVAVNRDPDAPIAEFADLMVVGDLFEVGRALLAELGARSG